MVWISADVDVDFDTVWESLLEREREEIVRGLAVEYPQWIPEESKRLELHPAHLLETITELRKLGYTVEPA